MTLDPSACRCMIEVAIRLVEEDFRCFGDVLCSLGIITEVGESVQDITVSILDVTL
jgi:hypothetical protein